MAKMGYEEAMKKLEEVVGRLETDEVSLEESLKLFEQGVKLMQTCHQRLNEIESRVQLLTRKADDDPGRLEDFPA